MNNFKLVLDKLPSQFGFLTIDFPNTGKSPISNQEGIVFSDYALALEEVCDFYQIEEFYLCLHSISGLIALQFLAQTKRKCLGILAIEPTTKEILFGRLAEQPYPELLALSETLARKKMTREDYLRQLSPSYFDNSSNHLLWENFEKSVSACQQVEDEHFLLSPELAAEELLYKISDQIPIIIFTQLFREEEYYRSEYWNHHSYSKVICAGTSHYLHWELAAEIIAELEFLLEQENSDF